MGTHGKPVAFYSDKHNIFRVNNKDAIGGAGMTQFGRALSALNIDIICANSPPAKGRVERAFGTSQDRLVKDCAWPVLRRWRRRMPGYLGSSTPTTSASAVCRRMPRNLHRPLAEADDLTEILAWRSPAADTVQPHVLMQPNVAP